LAKDKIVRVALLTNTISRPGGAEYVTIAIFNSLRALSKAEAIEVKVLGREKVASFNTLIKWIPVDLAYAIVSNYVQMPRFPLNLLKLKSYDLVINTRSNEVLSPAHIHYLHWVFSPYGVKNSEVITYYRYVYGISNQHIMYGVRHILHYIQLKITRLVLANSGYVANLLKEVGVNAKILYPPVRSKEIVQYTSGVKWDDRDKLVMTICRIAPGKQLELMPLIASRVKGVRFILAGSLYDESYYAKLLKYRKLLGAENFTIMPNLTRHKLYELLGKAMIYFHPAPHEPFGMAVVEGMAAGCIPVVHRSGGPYYDILGRKETYGFSYKDFEEAITIIKSVIAQKSHYEDLSERARQRSLLFDESVFSSKIRTLIESMI